MERTKSGSGGPYSKSWVATRYSLTEDAGKRRCKHVDCGKEYSRGTSHIILKRHWTKQHGTNDIDTINSSYRSSGASHPHSGANYNSPNKKPLKASNPTGAVRSKAGLQNTSNSNLDRKLAESSAQLDVKLVAKRLKEATSIHLTFDLFNAKKGGKTYGIITAHSLGENLEKKSVLLEYKHLPYPSDYLTIVEFLRSCLIKFNIKEKIVSITSNCSESIVTAIDEIEKKFRLSKNFGFSTILIKCFPQFIHMNVLDVLKTQETLIDSVRKVIGYINSNNVIIRPMMSENPSEELGTGPISEGSGIIPVIEHGAKTTGLRLPVDNRGSWNTTYNMIDTFLQQRGLIEPTLLYFQHPQELTNTNIDWDKLFTLKTLLKPFYTLIDHCVTRNCVPISLVAKCLPWLITHLTNKSWAYDDLVMAAHNFKSQLESYRQEFHNDLTIITSLLDPRIRATFMPDEDQDSVIDVLRKRVELMPCATVKQESNWKRDEDGLEDMFRHLDHDEVTDYMGRVREPVNIRVNDFWMCFKSVYPALGTLAKTLWCIEASSVPNDRMFSAGEHLDRERKQTDSINNKLLMKSWAKYLES